jgi:hypothetical protein
VRGVSLQVVGSVEVVGQEIQRELFLQMYRDVMLHYIGVVWMVAGLDGCHEPQAAIADYIKRREDYQRHRSMYYHIFFFSKEDLISNQNKQKEM